MVQAQLQLHGWSKKRRVVVVRQRIRGGIARERRVDGKQLSRPMGLPAALRQRPHRPHHRAAKAAAEASGDGITAGFRLKDRASLRPEAAADLDALIARMTTVRTARAWVYKERLREILERKQIHVVRDMLKHWCTRVMRSRVEPMKEVAVMVRRHLEGIVAWAQTRQTNGFLEALNGLFQAAKRRARGFTSFDTIGTVIFLIAGKPDFASVNPHAR
jgi:transposase